MAYTFIENRLDQSLIGSVDATAKVDVGTILVTSIRPMASASSLI